MRRLASVKLAEANEQVDGKERLFCDIIFTFRSSMSATSFSVATGSSDKTWFQPAQSFGKCWRRACSQAKAHVAPKII